MSAGDFYTRKNTSDTSAVPNAGSNLDSYWDTLVKNEGSIVTYSDPNFTVSAGLYLVLYSEKFYTSDTTNNERVEIQGEIHTTGGFVGGYGQDYIRKTSGQQECVVSGAAILELSSSTSIFIRFYRI